jgi:hypothetical protein
VRSPASPAALIGGLAVAALIAGGVVWFQWSAHTEIRGSILKVRTVAMDEASSVAVVDFRFANPGRYPFVVREVSVLVEDAEGKIVEGATVAESDARRLFEYYPRLGQKFNESLITRTRIPPRESMDRMIAARFEIPESALQNRRKLTVRVVDLDGPMSELEERK